MTHAAPSFRAAYPVALLSGLFVLAQPVMGQVYQSVDVRGAEFIPEDDIRLTCGDLEGVVLDDLQLRAVEECLMSTGVFERVSVTGQGDALVIDVTEVETRPGRIEVGLAWVNDYGPAGTLAYEQFNLIPGAFLGITNTYSRDYRSYAINLYHKETFGPTLHFGLDIAGERTSFDDQSFSTRKDLAEAYLAWTPDDNTRLEFGLGYRDHRLFDLDMAASPLLRAEAGKVTAPFVHFAVDYKQGTAADARSFSVRLDQYLWNLGTESGVAEARLGARAQFALGDTSALLVGVLGGIVAGRKGHQTTVLDRGFVGGESFRGFAPRGIGPADAGERLGGNRYVVGSVEYRRDLGSRDENPFQGGIFMDFGSVWALDNTLGGTIDDAARFRSSVGLSLTFDVATLPVSLYVAAPVKHRPGDKRQIFGLSAVARF